MGALGILGAGQYAISVECGIIFGNICIWGELKAALLNSGSALGGGFIKEAGKSFGAKAKGGKAGG
ncbi:expressed protein [Batrachochytrium dendrobatidis JAM81]|uniref:Expressed protein n=1 Tax=Batrachochytrium dendrobatidis (strain JAM81 / FGSC 10211) TaxID=684364 RepID=F4NYS3_BATDJ|nr:uncharacterized protein BATDEDRAFT_31455 [Batrachochytrium dendrobatidis JAM81]EGF81756.1 expressed protein [Batrachochytrium dendrobatidis JAM81]|eukprot:XP_006677382.1 expressed protein [Batrachochytrium dendrobatidis JAM81]